MRSKLICLVSFVLVLGVASNTLADLVNHWKFNEGAGTMAPDIGPGGNDGTIDGATWVNDPELGTVLSFDGVDDVVTMTGYKGISGGASRTFCMWIKTDDGGGDVTVNYGGRGLGGWGAAAGAGLRWGLVINKYAAGGTVDAIKMNISSGYQSGGTVVTDSTWHHVAAVLFDDGSPDATEVQLYIDGVEETYSATLDEPVNTPENLDVRIGNGVKEAQSLNYAGLIADVRVYDHALTADEILEVMMSMDTERAVILSPAHQATDVLRDGVVLEWSPGQYAASHDVYLGTSLEDVNTATTDSPEFKGNQPETSYALDRLELGTTYYWRIDEVNNTDPNSPWEGEVWSFTVESEGYLVAQDLLTASASSRNSADEDPNNTINGAGLNADGSHSQDKTTMWLSAVSDPGTAWIRYDLLEPQKLVEMLVWNHNTQSEEDLGYGIKDALIEVSADGINFTSLGTVELAQAAETTVALQDVLAQSVKITAQSNWGGLIPKYGLSEVRLYAMPMAARELSPADGDADVDPTTAVLTWRPGREADVHKLYISTDEQAVIDGTAPAVTLTEALYAPDLDLDTTSYWRVDEVNDLEDPAVWAGAVQSFSTVEYLVVDDMESYKSEDGKWIWETWTDGYDIASNGALLGHGGDDMETGIVHEGSQSLPYYYGQDGAAASEATLPIGSQDWSKYGIQSLVLWFYEDPNNVAGQLYVKVNGAKANYTPPAHKADPPGWGTGTWKPMIVDLASLGINLSSVTSLTIGVEGGSGLIYIDDIRLYKNAPTVELVETWFEAESGTYAAPMLLYDDVDGALNASGGKYIGTAGDLGDSTGALPTDGYARYSFSVDQAGVYKVALRHGDLDGGNSVWVNIPGAEKNTTGLAAADGWVKFNWDGMTDAFFWSNVHDTDDGSTIVEFTLTAGTHTLEIARREAGACIDAIAILAVPE